MKQYTIPNLPWEIDEILYDWQRAAILKKLESPIVSITEKDPIWSRLDDMLTTFNNILQLSKSGEIECSVHELLSGVNAVWIMDDMGLSPSPAQAILINGLDLESLREGGMNGLIHHRLFKGF